MSDIRDKIRKLLAVATNSGATEGEAANAMSMASALMARHGIEEGECIERKADHGVSGAVFRFDKAMPMWVLRAAQAAATLSTVDVMYASRGGDIYSVTFTGRADNRDMAEATLKYLRACVERAYKDNLKAYTANIRGLSHEEQVRRRAEFRKTFKYACATRLYTRAQSIMHEMQHSDKVAYDATGKNALVVVESIKEKLQEIEDYMKQQGYVVKYKTHKTPTGSGTQAGLRAGDAIKLRNELS